LVAGYFHSAYEGEHSRIGSRTRINLFIMAVPVD
jgi:hypothetical protein